jgi:hypothetical protein
MAVAAIECTPENEEVPLLIPPNNAMDKTELAKYNQFQKQLNLPHNLPKSPLIKRIPNKQLKELYDLYLIEVSHMTIYHITF